MKTFFLERLIWSIQKANGEFYLFFLSLTFNARRLLELFSFLWNEKIGAWELKLNILNNSKKETESERNLK